MIDQMKNQLFQLVKERSFQEGEFTLSSGIKSNHYIDFRLTSLCSKGISLIGNLIYGLTRDLDDLKGIGGMETGSIPLTTAVIQVYEKQGISLEGFFVRKNPKSHGTHRKVEGILIPGSKVVIVEDVITTGNSILNVIAEIKKQKCVPVLIISMIDREEGAKEKFKEMGIPYVSVFSISEFLKK